MGQAASGNDGSRTYSYTYTETYSFEEAIQKAINGSLDPSEIYRQGQSQLKKVIDSLAMNEFSKQFSELLNSQQREIMKKLLKLIEKEKEQSNQPLTMLDALKMAKDGLIDDLELFQSLPNELKEILDTISMTFNTLNFKDANLESRRKSLVFIIDMFEKNIEEDSKLKTEKLASTNSIQKTESDLKLQDDKEIKLNNTVELNHKNAKLCIVCGKTLGFFDILYHRNIHLKCKK